MKEVNIFLNGDIEKAKKLVNIASTYSNDVDMICGRYVFDCKSILSVMSVDLNRDDIKVRLLCDDLNEQKKFIDKMKIFQKGETCV